MNGKQRILKALSIEEADRVPLFIHGINEGPIMGVGKHLMEGLPVGKQVHQMTDSEKGVLIETLLRHPLVNRVCALDPRHSAVTVRWPSARGKQPPCQLDALARRRCR